MSCAQGYPRPLYQLTREPARDGPCGQFTPPSLALKRLVRPGGKCKTSWNIPRQFIEKRERLRAVAAFGADLRTAALQFSVEHNARQPLEIQVSFFAYFCMTSRRLLAAVMLDARL